MASSAWKKNTALSEEANKRYATTESKLKNLKNTALLFGQQIGDDLNPTIRSLIDGAEELLQGLYRISRPIVCWDRPRGYRQRHASRCLIRKSGRSIGFI